MKLLHQPTQRDATLAKLLYVVSHQVVFRGALAHERIDQFLNLDQVADIDIDAAGDLAAQENLTMPLHDALQVVVMEIEQRTLVGFHVSKRRGNDRHRHHEIAGKEHLVLTYMHGTGVGARTGAVNQMHRLATQANDHAFAEDQLGQTNLDRAQFRRVFFGFLERLEAILLEHLQARLRGQSVRRPGKNRNRRRDPHG